MMDLHFNQSLAAGYHSGSQISRVLTEDWMERNMFCPVCGAPVLGHYEANKPVADFFCEDCKSDFELKSKESKVMSLPYFAEFEPAHGLLVEEVVHYGQTFAEVDDFLCAESTAAECSLDVCLFVLQVVYLFP